MVILFNELYNGSDDANDYLELQNLNAVDLALDDWQLTIQTGDDAIIVPFPAGTVIRAGEVLLLTNTEMAAVDTSTSLEGFPTPMMSIVAETFALPQAEFALILRVAEAFGTITDN